MKKNTLPVILLTLVGSFSAASPPQSAIKARISGLVAETMRGNVIFSSEKAFSGFEVYLNSGNGLSIKVCQQGNPVVGKEYQCAFSATAASDVNAVNIYVVGVSAEYGAKPEQAVLAVANPAFQPSRNSAGVSVNQAPRLQLEQRK